MILLTERLRLAPLIQADAPLIFPLMSDPGVMAHWDVDEIDDPELIERIVAAQLVTMEEERAFHWSMRTLAGDAFIGCVDLSEIDHWHHRAEVGFILAPEAWGQGYANEAMLAVIAHAVELGLRRLSARTHVGNKRSDALLQRLGFTPEGLLRGYVMKDDERKDCRLWGLLL